MAEVSGGRGRGGTGGFETRSVKVKQGWIQSLVVQSSHQRSMMLPVLWIRICVCLLGLKWDVHWWWSGFTYNTCEAWREFDTIFSICFNVGNFPLVTSGRCSKRLWASKHFRLRIWGLEMPNLNLRTNMGLWVFNPKSYWERMSNSSSAQGSQMS